MERRRKIEVEKYTIAVFFFSFDNVAQLSFIRFLSHSVAHMHKQNRPSTLQTTMTELIQNGRAYRQDSMFVGVGGGGVEEEGGVWRG